MLQTKTARWSALTALACVALLGIAWVLLLSPRRAEAADIRDQAEAARSANDALQLQVAQLKAQFAELPKNKAELATIHTQMPVKAAMPELVRAVDAAAAASGVTLTALTPAGATALATAPAATPAPAASSAAGSTGGTAASAPAAPAAAAGGLRVVAIPVTIVVQGDYFQNVLFLKKLQTEMPRVFAVNSLQMVVGAAAGSGVTMTVGGSVFALPDAVDTTAASGTGSGTAATGSAGTTGTGTTGTGTTGTGTTGTGTTGGTAPGQATAWGGMSRVGATASRVAEDS